jgi:hypothetical protein
LPAAPTAARAGPALPGTHFPHQNRLEPIRREHFQLWYL